MDLRFALRSLRKQPVFYVTAILTLALGIGANTAIFSVFNAVILRPFPYRDAGRIVMVWLKRPTGQMNSVTGVHYRQWNSMAASFEKLSGLIPQTCNLGSGDDITQVSGARVTANFFETLGVQPALGRDFLVGEEIPGAHRVAIVTYGLWQRQFAKDPHRLGQAVLLNGAPYTLIGVLPRNFEFIIPGVEIWIPLVVEKQAELRATKMAVFGRLRASVSLEQANEEMTVISKRLEPTFPDYKKWGVTVMAQRDLIGGNVRPALTALLGAVGLVLLIACANVANLLLARCDARHKEVAIRSALGAGRTRLIRQLVSETMLLAVSGCAAGLALAYAGLRLLVAVAGGQLPRFEGLTLDARVLAFLILVTVMAGFLFGLLPARQLLKADVQTALRESGRGFNNGPKSQRSRNALMVAEIALSLMLASGAVLMLRSLLWLESQDRGFSAEHELTFRVSLSSPELSNPSVRIAYYSRLLERIRTVPGVRAVAASNNLPVDGYRFVGSYFRVDGAAREGPEPPSAAVDMVNPGYFRALGISILQGREFESHDQDGAAPVAVVSEALVRRFFSGENPLGHKVILATPGRGENEMAYEIVGVARDIRYLTKRPADSVEIYLPYAQSSWPAIYVVAKTDTAPSNVAPSIRAALRASGWRQPISDVLTIEQRIEAVNGKTRLNSLLALIFAAIALVLAAFGIYGVISYSVSQRTKEIGVRMALGASRGNILRWIVSEGLILAAAGVTLGLAGHFALSRMLRSLLYGTSPNDPFTWLTATLLVGLTALVASYFPARRASRGDPVTALRAE